MKRFLAVIKGDNQLSIIVSIIISYIKKHFPLANIDERSDSIGFANFAISLELYPNGLLVKFKKKNKLFLMMKAERSNLAKIFEQINIWLKPIASISEIENDYFLLPKKNEITRNSLIAEIIREEGRIKELKNKKIDLSKPFLKEIVDFKTRKQIQKYNFVSTKNVFDSKKNLENLSILALEYLLTEIKEVTNQIFIDASANKKIYSFLEIKELYRKKQVIEIDKLYFLTKETKKYLNKKGITDLRIIIRMIFKYQKIDFLSEEELIIILKLICEVENSARLLQYNINQVKRSDSKKDYQKDIIKIKLLLKETLNIKEDYQEIIENYFFSDRAFSINSLAKKYATSWNIIKKEMVTGLKKLKRLSINSKQYLYLVIIFNKNYHNLSSFIYSLSKIFPSPLLFLLLRKILGLSHNQVNELLLNIHFLNQDQRTVSVLDEISKKIFKTQEWLFSNTTWPAKPNYNQESFFDSLNSLRNINIDGQGVYGRLIYQNQYYYYESNIEKEVLKRLFLMPKIAKVKTQSTIIPYMVNGEEKNYYPDITVLTKDNRVIIIEIKILSQMAFQENVLKFRALHKYAYQNGFGYIIIDDFKHSFRNLKMSDESEALILKILAEKKELTELELFEIRKKNKISEQELMAIIIKNKLIFNQRFLRLPEAVINKK